MLQAIKAVEFERGEFCSRESLLESVLESG